MANATLTSVSSPASEESFYIKIIPKQDLERVITFFRQFFYNDEPLNAYLNIERNDTINTSGRGSPISVISEGLSVMAVTPSNEIIGAVINQIATENLEGHNINIEDHPNCIPIFKLVDILQKKVTDRIQLSRENEKQMYLTMISVHPDWRRKGVGTSLMERTKNIAQQNGFSQIRGICTNAFSSKLFEKMGFQCVDAIKYEDYKEDGEVVFNLDPPHTHIKAMLLRIR